MINHIGSTSVNGLLAKPTIDILLEIDDDTGLSDITEKLRNAGYVTNFPKQDLIMYLKGYTPHGFEGQVFHIHVRFKGDWNELYFRDYLIIHPKYAEEYARLKLKLKDLYLHDRDEYTEAKTEFIIKHSELAKIEFNKKYI